MASVHILADGYSRTLDGTMEANCSCVVIKGEHNIIIDTMTAWDGDYIIQGLLNSNYGKRGKRLNYTALYTTRCNGVLEHLETTAYYGCHYSAADHRSL